MFSNICLLLSIIVIVSAVDLNIYRSVSELRLKQNGKGTFQFNFINGEYSNIIDGSISWEGTPFVRQEIYSTVESLKGALVRVRNPTNCDCEIIEAKIIDPNTMLLENTDDGSVFYADPRTVTYVSVKPNNGGTTLTLNFAKESTNYDGTLSYLMTGVSWTPNYELSLGSDDTCAFAAYANIRNNQRQEYSVTNTNLYSGDVRLVNRNFQPAPQPIMRVAAKSVSMSSNSGVIQAAGEERGSYFYSIKTNYKLRPSSSIRLPFIEVHPQCHFTYKATTNIGQTEYKGVFQRNYAFKPDKFIPAGIVMIRDEKVLVGQSNIPDTPVNFEQTIVMGDDNDIHYSAKGNLTASNAEKERPTWNTYDVEITISNFKNKTVQGQLDFYGASRTSIDNGTCETAKVNGNMINLPFVLKKGDKLVCVMTVTLTWG